MFNKKLIILSIFAGGVLFLSSVDKKPQQQAVFNRPYIVHANSSSKVLIGQASWYSKKSPGIKRRTANNEKFDDKALTCAMWGIPFNKKIRVTNLDNGKSIIVRVNDRGPHTRYLYQGRIIDLTKEAFAQLASTHEGLINVRLEVL